MTKTSLRKGLKSYSDEQFEQFATSSYLAVRLRQRVSNFTRSLFGSIEPLKEPRPRSESGSALVRRFERLPSTVSEIFDLVDWVFCVQSFRREIVAEASGFYRYDETSEPWMTNNDIQTLTDGLLGKLDRTVLSMILVSLPPDKQKEIESAGDSRLDPLLQLRCRTQNLFIIQDALKAALLEHVAGGE